MRIQIVIPVKYREWIYPILKWKKEFKLKGVQFDILSSPDFKPSHKPDWVILTSRYYRNLFPNNTTYFKSLKDILLKDVVQFRSLGCKVVFYDTSASTGSRELHILPDVDLLLKRQIMKDKSYYTQPSEGLKYRIWMENETNDIQPCVLKDIHKIKIGWNLGYHDFRSYPLSLNRLGIYFYQNPIYTDPKSERPIMCGYRGNLIGNRSDQRQNVINILKELDSEKFVVGSKVSKSKYLKELEKSKTVVSPFGYGEICFRDMEAFIKGAILLKPNIEHIQTFPDVFAENETYIPLHWDLSDLKEKLLLIEQSYSDFFPIAVNGQKRYKELYESFPVFYDHFTNEISKSIGF